MAVFVVLCHSHVFDKVNYCLAVYARYGASCLQNVSLMCQSDICFCKILLVFTNLF